MFICMTTDSGGCNVDNFLTEMFWIISDYQKWFLRKLNLIYSTLNIITFSSNQIVPLQDPRNPKISKIPNWYICGNNFQTNVMIFQSQINKGNKITILLLKALLVSSAILRAS